MTATTDSYPPHGSFSATHIREIARAAAREVLAEIMPAASGVEPPDEGGIEMAAELTGLAVGTIYQLTHARRIPHAKHGKFLRFSRTELTKWDAARRISVEEVN